MISFPMPLGMMPLGSQSARYGKCTTRMPAFATSFAALSLLMAAPAQAQNGERSQSTANEALDAVTQPLSDFNLRSDDIPPILLRAQQVPYDLSAMDSCALLNAEITELNNVLGPDADAPEEEGSLISDGLRIGGNVLGGLIPFRGVVRQLSGANAQEARWKAAIYAGVARRSYIKGYAHGLSCGSTEEEALDSARDVLGIQRREVTPPTTALAAQQGNKGKENIALEAEAEADIETEVDTEATDPEKRGFFDRLPF